jgi:RNA polymerase sigma-70 factor, ECF subfamily
VSKILPANKTKRVKLTILEEQWLLHRVRAHDRDAAEKLIDEFYPRVYRFLCAAARNQDAARDLTQETFYRFWNSLERFQNRCRLITWLFQIAYHAFLDESRKKKSRGGSVAIEELELAGDDIAPQDDVFHQLKGLPEEQSRVIMLFYYEDLSLKQIAAILKIPVGTVKSRLHAAKIKLKEIMAS